MKDEIAKGAFPLAPLGVSIDSANIHYSPYRFKWK